MSVPRSAVWLLWTAVGLWSAAACGGEGNGDWTGALRDSAGVAVVENRGPDRTLDWELRPIVRIGSLGGEDALSRIGRHRVAAGPDGRIYVLDGGSRRILVFDGDGTRVRTLGGEGGGPGEMTRPGAVSVAGDGRIHALDPVGPTRLEWSPGGDFVRERVVTVDLGETRVVRPNGEQIAVEPAGQLLAEVQGGFRAGRDSILRGIVRLGPAGDTSLVRAVYRPRPAMQNYGCVAIQLPPLFAPEMVWDAAGRQVAVADGEAYTIRLYESGDLIRVVRRDVPRVRVTEEMARKELGDGIVVRTPRRDCSISADELVEERGFAPRLPAVAGVALAPDGTLWVRRPTGHDESAVDVFDPEGRYLGTAEGLESLPADFLSPDTAIFVRQDSLGIERAEVTRVVRP